MSVTNDEILKWLHKEIKRNKKYQTPLSYLQFSDLLQCIYKEYTQYVTMPCSDHITYCFPIVSVNMFRSQTFLAAAYTTDKRLQKQPSTADTVCMLNVNRFVVHVVAVVIHTKIKAIMCYYDRNCLRRSRRPCTNSNDIWLDKSQVARDVPAHQELQQQQLICWYDGGLLPDNPREMRLFRSEIDCQHFKFHEVV